MENTEKYRIFCNTAPDLPLFMQHWYLDAICENGGWGAAVVEESGHIVAVMPWFLKRKWHYRYIAMPVLGKFFGPYILPELRNHNREINLYKTLLDQLPKGLAAFEQDMHYGVTNWLPFFWRGFRQTTRYSYILDLNNTEQALFYGISANYRRKISKAENLVEIVPIEDINAVYRLCTISFERQKLAPPYSLQFIQKLYTVLRERHAVQCFLAVDLKTGANHSSGMLVWDNTTAYFIMSGDDPALRASGASVFLKWHAIKFACSLPNIQFFDFEGSMIKRIEQGRREFGAIQRPYFRIQKEWKLLWRLGKLLLR